MKIFVTGTRGLPDIPGGVEKHCQELYPRIVTRGHEVILATRKSYMYKCLDDWRGVKLKHIYAPRKKSLEAILHTFLAILKARTLSPDIVHIHAIGPSLLTPFARMLGLKVVVTNHGPDYDRQKWGRVAKFILRFGEKMGGLFANEVIVISTVIADIIKRRCRRTSHLIYNGVTLPEKCQCQEFLHEMGILPGKYLLNVARFVPEKGLHELIEAFNRLEGEWTLVIAGDTDHETEYSRQIKNMAAQNERIILTGYIGGNELKQVLSHARLFVLPSYHEGLPIALLEAKSYGLPVLVSDIPANLEVALDKKCYFRCGDTADLYLKMIARLKEPVLASEWQSSRDLLQSKYDWDHIADETINVYKKALGLPSLAFESQA